MNCYFCHWGWPKPIQSIYDDALKRLKAIGYDEMALEHSFAHIVWSDENFASDNVEWCLNESEKGPKFYDLSQEAFEIVKGALESLLKVDQSFCHAPEGYDGENPEKFPPPKEWGIE